MHTMMSHLFYNVNLTVIKHLAVQNIIMTDQEIEHVILLLPISCFQHEHKVGFSMVIMVKTKIYGEHNNFTNK